MEKDTDIFLFTYNGINKAGQKIKGEIQTKSRTVAKVELYKQGISTYKIIKKRKSLFATQNKKITSEDISVFSRQLAIMIESGIPLLQAFDIANKGQSKAKMRCLIGSIKRDVETGLTLSEALNNNPIYFNELFCNLIKSGENSGTLDVMLDKVATYKEKIEAIKKKIKKTLTYPITIIVIALIVITGLLVFVVPQFEALFRDFGANLPAFTQLIINLSNFFQSFWYIILGIFTAGLYSFIKAKNRSQLFAKNIDRHILKLPVVGTILKKAAIARLARTLSITFAAGLPLVEALKYVAGATGNIIFAQGTNLIREEVAKGISMNVAMKHSHLFPDMVIQMVAVGEESGTLEKMLSKVADYYEAEVDNAIDALSSLLEPIIMSILGILVGGLVIAMYLPIFKLGSVI